MIRFQIFGLLLIIGIVMVIGCKTTQSEAVAGFPKDQETVKIGGDVSLINLSQNAKSHTLTFGEGHTLTRTQKIPTQATQIHEKSFYVCPAPGNPGLLLVGKIRVEISKGLRIDIIDEISPNKTNEITPGPENRNQ